MDSRKKYAPSFLMSRRNLFRPCQYNIFLYSLFLYNSLQILLPCSDAAKERASWEYQTVQAFCSQKYTVSAVYIFLVLYSSSDFYRSLLREIVDRNQCFIYFDEVWLFIQWLSLHLSYVPMKFKNVSLIKLLRTTNKIYTNAFKVTGISVYRTLLQYKPLICALEFSMCMKHFMTEGII